MTGVEPVAVQVVTGGVEHRAPPGERVPHRIDSGARGMDVTGVAWRLSAADRRTLAMFVRVLTIVELA